MGLIEKLEQIKTLVENGAGGGGEDWKFKSIQGLFGYYKTDNTSNIDIFYDIAKHIDIQATPNMYYFIGRNSGAYATQYLTNEIFAYIVNNYLPYATKIEGIFDFNAANVSGDYEIDLSNCTTMASAFSRWFDYYKNGNIITLNFNGTTKNVTSFNSTFRGQSGHTQLIKEITNINLDKVTDVSFMFYNANALLKLTFQGSFGGLSTSSSLTLDLTETILEHDAIIETFTTIGENTNAKTRIIELSSDLYSTLTEDEIAIATNKGYTITSA